MNKVAYLVGYIRAVPQSEKCAQWARVGRTAGAVADWATAGAASEQAGMAAGRPSGIGGQLAGGTTLGQRVESAATQTANTAGLQSALGRVAPVARAVGQVAGKAPALATAGRFMATKAGPVGTAVAMGANAANAMFVDPTTGRSSRNVGANLAKNTDIDMAAVGRNPAAGAWYGAKNPGKAPLVAATGVAQTGGALRDAVRGMGASQTAQYMLTGRTNAAPAAAKPSAPTQSSYVKGVSTNMPRIVG